MIKYDHEPCPHCRRTAELMGDYGAYYVRCPNLCMCGAVDESADVAWQYWDRSAAPKNEWKRNHH